MQGAQVRSLVRQLRARMPQLKIPCAATKTQCSQINIKKKKRCQHFWDTRSGPITLDFWITQFILFYFLVFFFNIYLFIYFGCTGSSLRHADSLVVACMRDLVPRPGMEPGSPALGARSLTHWTTREVPWVTQFKLAAQMVVWNIRLEFRSLGFKYWLYHYEIWCKSLSTSLSYKFYV